MVKSNLARRTYFGSSLTAVYLVRGVENTLIIRDHTTNTALFLTPKTCFLAFEF